MWRKPATTSCTRALRQRSVTVQRFSGEVRMHYKIHFATKEWMPRNHLGILVMHNSPRGTQATRDWKEGEKAFLRKLDTTMSVIEKLLRRYESMPRNAKDEWVAYRGEVVRSYRKPRNIKFEFPMIGFKERAAMQGTLIAFVR